MRALKYFFDEALGQPLARLQDGAHRDRHDCGRVLVLGGFLVVTVQHGAAVRALAGGGRVLGVPVATTSRRTQRAAIEKRAARQQRVGRRDRGGLEGRGAAALQTEFRRRWPRPRATCLRIRCRRRSKCGCVRTPTLPTSKSLAQTRLDARRRRRRALRPSVDSASDECGRPGARVADSRWPSLLVFAAALTVASVVRLALVARREEIHIMQLVGAPMAYIRGPFVVEGLHSGRRRRRRGARRAVDHVFRRDADGQLPSLAGAIDPASLVFLSIADVRWRLLAGGMAVGSLGGLIAARARAKSPTELRLENSLTVRSLAFVD